MPVRGPDELQNPSCQPTATLAYDIGLRLAERASRTRTSGDTAKNVWCDTIRTKLLKIGAAVTITVRKVWVQLASACPYHQVFADAWKNLCDGKTSCGSVTPNRPATRQVRMESSSRISVTMPWHASIPIRLQDRDRSPLRNFHNSISPTDRVENARTRSAAKIAPPPNGV